ncbi:tRNA adenosine(34) deaminase TadA [Methylogaea oryzae]|uniref:tRNA-specific adenosine deaminase n=1 Tax=Methylogaea oryzae TaxID=1295382 RepID=A0A8D5ALG0_9GAMM|nr:tRNA adenosine(34) deaminase TadA [Methylogaea oryzae]BBL70095.1 tRNA-specific adenosine deaminase [Methylogaea oryzae]
MQPAPEFTETDMIWMRRALELARQAEAAGEVPIGAVVVKDDTVIAEGWNRPISSNDPTAHAEIVALRAAGLALDNYRLVDTTLYVTLEPCIMCMGGIIHARVANLVYGAPADAQRSSAAGVLQMAEAQLLNHRLQCRSGLLADEAAALLRDFFRRRR